MKNENQTKPVEMRKSFSNAFRSHSSLSMSFFLQGMIIYWIWSNEKEFVENLTTGETFGTSGHCVIKWDMVIKKNRNSNCNRVIFDYCTYIDWSEIIKGYNVEDDWVAFKKVIIDIKDNYIPKKVIKFHLKQNG